MPLGSYGGECNPARAAVTVAGEPVAIVIAP